MKNILFLAFVAFLISCAYNESEIPQPIDDTDTGNEPEITYTNYVKSVIDNNCIVCHFTGYNPNGSAAGNRDLRTFQGVKDIADNGSLGTRAIDVTQQPSMPFNLPELPDSTKGTLQLWIDQGTLE